MKNIWNKRYCSLIFLIVVSSQLLLSAQNTIDDETRYSLSAEESYDAIRSLGRVLEHYEVIEPFKFRNGLARVSRNGKWGYINFQGEEVIPCQYNQVSSFSEGLAYIRRGDLWGYIDKTGQEVIECEFLSSIEWQPPVRSFSDSLAAVSQYKKWGFINHQGQIVIPCIYERVGDFHEGVTYAWNNGETVILNHQGKVLGKRPKIHNISDFSEGLAILTISLLTPRAQNEYEFVNTECEQVISEFEDFGPGIGWVRKFYIAGGFHNGLALVIDVDSSLYGFINRGGNLIIPCQYSQACDFHEGLAVVTKNGKLGFINTTGELVIPMVYEEGVVNDIEVNIEAHSFSEGLAAVYKDGKWGYISSTGEIAIPFKFDVSGSFSEGFAVVEINGKWGLIDKYGNCSLDVR